MSKMIYIADDEKNIRDLIATFLIQEGFEVKTFTNGDDLLLHCNQDLPNLVILDIIMSGTDGLSVCSHLRKSYPQLPIIIVSAKDTAFDRVTGLTIGSDDYLIKPFLPLELVARVRALLRRTYNNQSTYNELDNKLKFGPMILSPGLRTALLFGEPLTLTPTEFDFLMYLIKHKERAVSREELLETLWKMNWQSDTRATDDLVKRLLKKLRERGSTVHIETVWGFGFRISLEGESSINLVNDFVEYINNFGSSEIKDSIEFKSTSGEVYLVNFYNISEKSSQLKYIITYCSTYKISNLIRNTSTLVLIISSVFVLITIIMLWINVYNITQHLRRLNREAKQIGNGNFVQIQPPFTIKELEDLRVAMNDMSKELMNTDQIKQNFFQNVSHELRNPLMSISGYAQGIEQNVFSSPNEAAHIILDESKRLTQLVNSLLTLSKIENCSNSPKLYNISLIDSIENCLDRIHGLSIQSKISVSILPFNKLINVYANDELLEKIIDNLLTNAIRHANTAVYIKVTEENEKISLSIIDDGNGISEKDFPHLFERCYKGEKGNFGIGLAIAQAAADSIKGTLSAANNQNEGAVFTLTLPQL